ncbi:hypothetical protein OG401_29335 [Kitasatospora purpeofusca]|uniref:hypothetical protein n=1 Tax=Kitasatospora purpeofusca TaxID=67352 RepID=UPI002255347C|nr:hypothetical protein [Kitasatospora purpeofusca]MCX4688354.1 hypothetical protein [Kitasatospora purpeofusca]
MGPSEDTGQDTAYPHDRNRTRHGRHGRPGPFGGRLRLPTLRFSGAAMAMSTVVGISIATTLLLNEQQGVGRRAGVARVGSSAPPPSPAVGPDSGSGTASGRTSGPASGTTADQEADASAATAGRPPATPAVPVPGPTGPDRPNGADNPNDPNNPTAGPRAPGSTPGPRSTTPAAPRGGSPTGVPLAEGPPPRHGVTGEPAGGHGAGTGTGTTGGGQDTLAAGQTAEEQPASRNADRPTADRPAEEPAPTATAPATPGPSPSPTASRPLAPVPGTPTPPPPGWTGETLTDPGTGGTDPAPEKGGTTGTGDKGVKGDTDTGRADELALTGAALVQQLGRDGTRHLLSLTVTEPLTALQAEFRLAPGALAPGAGTVWTDLAGAVITAHQERGAAVYRFTTPPGTDVRPGRYTFAVLGVRPPAPRRAVPRTAESWKAGAFGIDRPRAVAALGTFAAPSGTDARPGRSPGPTAPASVPAPAPAPAPAR